MPQYKSNVADYDLLYVTQTKKAIGVRRSEESEVIWLPKSEVDFEDKEYKRNSVVSVTIPDWLAEKHDLA
jgi:hypothetical protein